MPNTVISVEHLTKRYDLGVIGTGTLSRDLNRWWARVRRQPDPYTRIGQEDKFKRIGESILALDDVSFTVDLGLPGLVLYSALLGGFAKMALHTHRTGRTFIKALSFGLACGMLSHQVFGLIDAFMLGAKLCVVMWVYFGLMAALFVHLHSLNINLNTRRSDQQAPIPPGCDQVMRNLADLLVGLALWISISLAAATFVTLSPYLSITLAIASGIWLGITLTNRFRVVSHTLIAFSL